MAYQADSVFVPILPSFRGFGAAMGKGTVSAAADAGDKAGQSFSKAFGAKAASGGAGVEALQKRLAAAVNTAAQKVKAARTAEEDATRKARIEELKLQELRDSGKAKASQLAQAEDRLVKAQRALTRAQDDATKATQDQNDALDRQQRELKQTEEATDQSVKGFGRLRGSVKSIGSNVFSKLATSAKREGAESGKTFGSAFGGGLKGAIGVAGAAFALVKGFTAGSDFIKSSLEEGREAQKVGAVSAQIIKATGRAANVTEQQLGDLTTAISNKTGVDDEAIQSGANLLLTFKNVRNEAGLGANIFDRATAAAVDLNKAGFGSIESGSKMLGKALNDPLKGISALSRAGVTFTQQQKDQIATLVKSGDTLSAQKIILREVESQVGGVAAKSATAGEKLTTTFNNLKEGIGTAFLPLIDRGANALTTKLLPAISSKLLPALPTIVRGFKVVGRILESFGKVAAGAFGPFIESLTGGRKGLKGFVEFLETNEQAMVSTFISLTRGAINFGRVLAKILSLGLRGYAFQAEAVSKLATVSIDAFGTILHAAAMAFRWIPGMSEKFAAADDSFQEFAVNAKKGFAGAGTSVRGFVEDIDGKMVPALDAAEKGLDKVASIQLNKAHLRDEAAKAAQAIKGIGTAADGSQIKLKHWADRTKLGADQQAGLERRIDDARKALDSQLGAVRKAEGGQKQLTKAWETGKDRLYREFKQMGLSNEAARKLAARYAGVKPKVETKFTQPGMSSALHDVKLLDTRLEAIKSQGVSITFSTNAATVAAKLKKLRLGGSVPRPTPSQPSPLADGGEIIGKGGPRQDNIAGIDRRTGLQTAWVSAKEFVVNAAAYAKNRALVQAINAGKRIHAGVVGRKDGGEIPRRASGGAIIRIKYGNVPQTALELAAIANQSASAGAFQTGLKLRRYGISGLQKLLDAARARQAAKAGGGNGGYKGPVGSGASGIIRIARSFNPSYIAGHRDPQGGPAFDIGSSGRKNTNIGNALRSNHGKLGLRYVIRQMQIASARGGWGWRRYTPITGSGDFRHVNHVHVSYANGGEVKKPKGLPLKVFDNGGYLPPGLSMAYNGTSGTEPAAVFTKAQQRAMQAIASGRGQAAPAGHQFNISGADPRVVAREVLDLLNLNAALAG